MRTTVVSIQITEPCSQSWELMKDTKQGRYCESCEKCVVDFSDYSNADIVKFLSTTDDKVCGRLTVEQHQQLNYYLLAVPSNKNWLKYLGVLAIGASLFLGEAKAVNTKPNVEFNATVLKNITDNKPVIAVTIYGFVFDEENKPIANLKVFIANTKLFGITDKNGRYEIMINQPLKKGTNLIQIDARGYVAATILNIAVAKQPNLLVRPVPMIMGGLGMVKLR